MERGWPFEGGVDGEVQVLDFFITFLGAAAVVVVVSVDGESERSGIRAARLLPLLVLSLTLPLMVLLFTFMSAYFSVAIGAGVPSVVDGESRGWVSLCSSCCCC